MFSVSSPGSMFTASRCRYKHRKGTPSDRRTIVGEAAAKALIAALCCAFVPCRLLLKGWRFPLMVAGQIANLRGIAEHGMTTGGSEFTDTRTVATPPALPFMMCNINYHLEHHLYTGVPWYNLPRLHKVHKQDLVNIRASVYTSQSRFIVDVGRVLLRGVAPGLGWSPATSGSSSASRRIEDGNTSRGPEPEETKKARPLSGRALAPGDW
jgi:hypothetical protein